MKNAYRKFALVIAINTVIMFLLTYAMIASFDHFYPNINRAYMTIIMVAPMVITMITVMKAMYTDKKLNTIIYILFTVLFIGTFFLARNQIPVGNEQFLRSMIPHHSSAIVMCEESSITDPVIQSLCEDIVKAQLEEISIMKDMLTNY